MLSNTVKLVLAIVMSIIFGPLKLIRGHHKLRLRMVGTEILPNNMRFPLPIYELWAFRVCPVRLSMGLSVAKYKN